VGDTFWMDDEVKVNWEEPSLEYGNLIQEPEKPLINSKLSFMDYQINKAIFEKALHPGTDTGSLYLYQAWKKNLTKVNFAPAKLQLVISLN
jgi:hypothetical protein